MKRLMKPILFLFCVYLSACSGENGIEITFEFDKIPLKDKMKLAVDDEYLSALDLTENEKVFIHSFYASRKFKPLWINDSMLNTTGRELKSILENKLSVGIPETRKYSTIKKEENFIQNELRLTISLAEMLNDLKHGFLIQDSVAYKPKQLLQEAVFNDYLKNIKEQKMVQLCWQAGPKDINYQELAKYIYENYKSGKIDRTRYEIKSFKQDSLKAIEQTSVALYNKGYLEPQTVDSNLFTNALIAFQNDNELTPDGLIGNNTAKALNESSFDRLNRVALEMERIRQAKKYPEKYLRINLPEYMLRFYINDSLKAEHNIVIGKLGNETPQLATSVRKIIAYPYWKVPYSISSKEILPSAQRNPNYFAKNNYKIYRNDVEVDPLTVNWKSIRENSFPYVVVQDPGPKNSLGIIKFDMPNAQSIYIHDTPSKGLFHTRTRSYSHGCMRCNNPIDLAKLILERDERMKKFNTITPDSLDSIIARGMNFEIPLLTQIPVIMEYRTVVVRENKVHVFLDIYGREEEYLRLFTGKS